MILLTVATPVAVLVLAWDEATPAVRALVEAHEEAAPAFDSVVVVVPAAPPAAALTQEEFLPLAAEAELLEAPPPPAVAEAAADVPAEKSIADAPTPPPPANEPAPASSIDTDVTVTRSALTLPTAVLPTDAQPAAAPAPTWAEVRIIRLSSFSLPALADLAGQALPAPAWLATSIDPAAPYVGRSAQSAAASAPAAPQAQAAETAFLQEVETTLPAEVAMLSPTPPAAANAPLATQVLMPTAPSPVTVTLAAGEPDNLDAEADTAPLLTTDEDDTAVLLPVAPPPFAPELASWPEALAALREPAAVLEAAPEPLVPPPVAGPVAHKLPEPAYPALQPTASSFAAPDLNFQVIQYARFAVPVALAEADFAAIYAPAWPTWLAAQELRQRTGRPLVLHVTSLAAGADEAVETATGWQAELQRQTLHRADLVLTETPALAERLHRELNLPAGLVYSVPVADTATIAYALHNVQPRLSGSMG